MSQTAPRPSTVSSACLFIGLSSGLLLVYVMGWLMSWDSLQQQELIADMAETARTIDPAVLEMTLRVVMLFLVVVLVTGAVGAFYAARGHRLSRILITAVGLIVALLFFLSGNLLGLIPGAFALASVIRLWGREANRWFAARNGLEPAAVAPASPTHTEHPELPPPPPPISPPPPPISSSATPPSSIPPPPIPPLSVQQPVDPPFDSRTQWTSPPPIQTSLGRPAQISTAWVVTLIGSLLASAVSAIYLLIYVLVPRETLISLQLDSPLVESMNITESDIVQSLDFSAVLAAAALGLSFVALAVAWSLKRGRAWARIALIVLSVITISIGLVTLIGLIWSALAVWVLVLINSRPARSWPAQRAESTRPDTSGTF